jgi:hypothetical protein
LIRPSPATRPLTCSPSEAASSLRFLRHEHDYDPLLINGVFPFT